MAAAPCTSSDRERAWFLEVNNPALGQEVSLGELLASNASRWGKCGMDNEALRWRRKRQMTTMSESSTADVELAEDRAFGNGVKK